MKLSIDVRKFYDSGVGTYLNNLLPTVIDDLVNFHIVLIGDSHKLKAFAWSKSRHIQIVDYRRRPYSPQEQIELLRIIPKDTTLLWVPFINVPALYPGKLLATVYDMNFLALPQFLSASQRLYAKAMFGTIRRKAAHVLCISEYTRKEYLRFFPGHEDKTTVTLLGTPPRWLNAQPTLPNPSERPYFLFVGNVKPHKNLVRLVQAFRKIMTELPHDLVIVGKRDGFIIADDDVSKELVDLGDRVHFTGYIGDDQLGAYYAHATALVYPSLYEGFGFPPLEAMACGCPVIASNVTSIPESCGDAARYCDPYSMEDIAAQMKTLASDTRLREDMIERGRRHAAAMTWDDCANKTINVIRNLLQA